MKFAATSVAVLIILLVVIWTFQRRMIYFPIGQVPSPEEGGLSHVQPVRFTTSDGNELDAWFLAIEDR